MSINYAAMIRDSELQEVLKRLRGGDRVQLSEGWAQAKSSYRRTDCLFLCSLFLANVLHKGDHDLFSRMSDLFDSSFYCSDTPLLLQRVGEKVKATYCLRASWDHSLYAPFIGTGGTYLLIRLSNANTTHFVTLVSNGRVSYFYDPYQGFVEKTEETRDVFNLSLGIKPRTLIDVESAIGLKTDRMDICKFKRSYLQRGALR